MNEVGNFLRELAQLVQLTKTCFCESVTRIVLNSVSVFCFYCILLHINITVIMSRCDNDVIRMQQWILLFSISPDDSFMVERGGLWAWKWWGAFCNTL